MEQSMDMATLISGLPPWVSTRAGGDGLEVELDGKRNSMYGKLVGKHTRGGYTPIKIASMYGEKTMA
jgi:hypothetical protein